jgi:hypothetical protein
LVRTPGNLLFEAMNRHVWRRSILRLRHGETSEAKRETGQSRGAGVSITLGMERTFFFLSRHPQVFDASSTAFPQVG